MIFQLGRMIWTSDWQPRRDNVSDKIYQAPKLVITEMTIGVFGDYGNGGSGGDHDGHHGHGGRHGHGSHGGGHGGHGGGWF